MEAKDLRIGNYVNEEGNIVCVCSGCIDFYADKKNNYIPEPITLTEEILLKCGFEKFNDNCFMIKYNAQGQFFIFSNNSPVGVANKIKEPFYYMFNGLVHTLEAVHVLQNLYFAITGTELEINL